jgi:NAD(P)-dependent dehydrogenase (short-subunit alcohol dehydrogenase family)
MKRADSAVAAGRVLWLVGASSGIGRCLALQLAAAGWQVAASARSAERLNELAGAAPGGRVQSYPLDVTDAAAVSATVARIEVDLGPIELAILNAGDYEPMPLADFDAGLFRRLMEVNYMGAVHCLDALVPRLRQRRRGQLVLTASVSGYRGLPRGAPYSATKAALINLAEALQPELASEGVRMRVINPGFVDTPLTRKNRFAMPFLMSAEQAAARIVTKLDAGSFEIAFPRRMVWLMKLLRCLPYGVYFALVKRMTGT